MKPNGLAVNSQGREPLVSDHSDIREPRRGGRKTVTPGGFVHITLLTRGSRPWLLTAAPSGLVKIMLAFKSEWCLSAS